ncbi:MAG: hypothetical protein ACKVU4_09575 [Phycisphaerales bacterium]
MPALAETPYRAIPWSVLAGPGAFALTLLALSLAVAGATVSGVDAAAVGVLVGVPTLAIAATVVVVRAFRLNELVGRALFSEPAQAEATIAQVLDCAERSHRDGPAALADQRVGSVDPLLAIGVHLIIAGAEPTLIRAVLERRLDEITRRQVLRHRALNLLARVGPIAAVPVLAVAAAGLWSMRDGLWPWWSPLLAGGAATLALPVLVFAGPIGAYSARRVAARALTCTLVIEGVMAIRSAAHPRSIEARLRSLMPPAKSQATATAAAA